MIISPPPSGTSGVVEPKVCNRSSHKSMMALPSLEQAETGNQNKGIVSRVAVRLPKACIHSRFNIRRSYVSNDIIALRVITRLRCESLKLERPAISLRKSLFWRADVSKKRPVIREGRRDNSVRERERKKNGERKTNPPCPHDIWIAKHPPDKNKRQIWLYLVLSEKRKLNRALFISLLIRREFFFLVEAALERSFYREPRSCV